MASPHPLNRVAVELIVCGQDWQSFDQSLRNQQAIEGIRVAPCGATGVDPVYVGEARDPQGMRLFDGQDSHPHATDLLGEDGRAYGLDVERGHPVLMSMFYTTCPMACPLLIERVKGILDDAGPAASDARVLLVSMDPTRDDVAALKQAWTERGLDARWHLAAPPPAQMREVAALLDIQVRQSPDGGFAHTSVVVLVSEDGRPIARAEGEEGRAELITALRR